MDAVRFGRCSPLTTRHRVLTSTLDPHLQHEPTDRFARMLHGQVNGMISSLAPGTLGGRWKELLTMSLTYITQASVSCVEDEG